MTLSNMSKLTLPLFVYRFLSHGRSWEALAPVACVLIGFIINCVGFDAGLHIPSTVALIIVLSTTFTTVSPRVLMGASVVCIVVAFFAAYEAYFLQEDSEMCKNPLPLTENATSEDKAILEGIQEFCDERVSMLRLQIAAVVVWVIAAMLVWRMPEPCSFAEGQTVTFDHKDVVESVDDDQEVV